MTKNNEQNNERKNSKFNGRETTVKGFIVNATDSTNVITTPFEETVSYVRAVNEATKKVREKMQLDDNPLIIVSVVEIINEKPKPVKLNNGKIVELAFATFDNKEKADNELNHATVDAKLVTIPWYEYDGQFWAYDEVSDMYITDAIHDESHISMTKIDMRSLLGMSAEQLTGFKVLALHNCTKKEMKKYCLIKIADYNKCIEK